MPIQFKINPNFGKSTGFVTLVSRLAEETFAGRYDDNLLQQTLSAIGNPSSVSDYLPASAVFQWCQGCGNPAFSRNMHRAYGGKQYVCDRCKGEWYIYCKQCESLILRDDDRLHVHADELVSFMQLNELAHYKTNPLDVHMMFLSAPGEPNNWRNGKTRFFGIEVELEKRNDRPLPPDLIAKSVAAFPHKTIIAKKDGSLSKDPNAIGMPQDNGSNGWELCSMPGTLAYHRSLESGWLRFFEVMRPFVQERPNTTGLHFHVSLDSVDPLTVAKVSTWVNAEINRELLVTVADRDFNVPSPTPPHKVYAPTSNLPIDDRDAIMGQLRQVSSMRKHDPNCPFYAARRAGRMYYYHPRRGFVHDHNNNPIIIRIDTDPLLVYRCRCKRGSYQYKDHYAALNLKTGKETFEFRLFRFSMNERHFFAALEFVDALIDYCSQSSIASLTTKEFISWYERTRRRFYPSLTQWLVDARYLASRKGR